MFNFIIIQNIIQLYNYGQSIKTRSMDIDIIFSNMLFATVYGNISF